MMLNDQPVELSWIILRSKWVFQDKENRLNASSYSFESIKAREILEALNDNSVYLEPISNLSERIFVGARVKRLFTNPKDGIPYLMPIDLFMFNLKPRKWVREETEDIENWWVKPFTILITQSGTPGRCLLVNKLFKDKVVSPNIIRIVPNEEGYKVVGYLYAFLNTWIGQAFLTKDQYGATVKHIEPRHIANIPIPRIPDLEEEINQKILEAHKLREEAQELLLKAEEMIYSELKLPKIDEDDVEYFGGETGKLVKTFEIRASELDYRLDASYHVPIAHLIISNLRKSQSGYIKKLKEVANSFVPPRFKRPYVKDPNDGIPLLQGTHIPQIKPLDIKYIWKRMKNIEAYIVRKNWILVTCSGTIGRLALVSNYWDGWAATNHLLRIIPEEKEINPGYLAGFLLSIYGQVQFQRLTYGGVVDEIGEAGELFNDILILKPKDKSIEDKIGSLVIEAYNKKDEANQIEEEAIKKLENTLLSLST